MLSQVMKWFTLDSGCIDFSRILKPWLMKMGTLEQKWGPKNWKRSPWGPGPPNGDPCGHSGIMTNMSLGQPPGWCFVGWTLLSCEKGVFCYTLVVMSSVVSVSTFWHQSFFASLFDRICITKHGSRLEMSLGSICGHPGVIRGMKIDLLVFVFCKYTHGV